MLEVPKVANTPEFVGSIDSEFITAEGKLEDQLLIHLDLERIMTEKKRDLLGEIAQ